MKHVALLLLAIALRATGQTIPVGDPLLGPAPGIQNPIGIATARDVMLAAWSGGNCGTCLRRMTTGGTFLDDAPLMLPGISNAHVASDGDRFLVLGFDSAHRSVELTRVERDGSMNAIPTTLTDWPYALAGAAGGYAALLWGRDVTFLRIDRNGLPIASPVKTVLPLYGSQFAMAMNDGGVALAITTIDPNSVNGPLSIIDLGAAPTIANPIPGTGTRPDIASDGTGFLATWVTGSFVGRQSIVAQPLDEHGQPSGEPVVMPVPDLDYSDPRVTWTGSEYRIAWIEKQGTHYAARNASFSRSGMTPVQLAESDAAMQLAAFAGGGGNAFAMWRDSRFYDSNTYSLEAYGALSGPHAAPDPSAPRDGVLVSKAPQVQVPEALLWCGDSYFAAWREYGGPERIRLSRFAGGQRIEPAGVTLPLFNETAIIDQESPAIVCGNDQCGVAWLETARATKIASVHLALYRHGDLSAHPRIVTLAHGADAIGGLTAAFDGERFVLAWRNATTKVIEAARVTEDGFRFDAAPIVLTDTGPTRNGDAGPLLSWNGNEFLLVWQHLPPALGRVSVMTWRFTRELTPLSLPARIEDAYSIDSSRSAHPDYVSVAATPGGWVLAATRFWELDALGLPLRSIDLGTTLDPRAIAIEDGAAVVAFGRIAIIRNSAAFFVGSNNPQYVWNVATGGPQGAAFVTESNYLPKRAWIAPLIVNVKRRRTG